MKLLEFIKENQDWESILVEKPYCLKIKKDDDYTLLSYDQIHSDFYNEIVRECRGIILENKTLTPVCVPFFKFGNYGEGYVPDIDWGSATTQEKVDGSLIKVWFHNGKWRVSTNGTIDAYKCDIGQVDFLKIDCPYKYFGELFDKAKESAGLNFDDYKSDIDTKAIVLPSFEDVVYGRPPISTTLVRENNEHIDIKDVRVMLDTFKKQNINFLEILFTKFKIINPKYKDLIQPLFDYNERIARLDINKGLNCQSGMSQQKLVALKHPYPTIIDKIKKYGYDPKQLHHIIRMFDFINKYVKGRPYSECLIADDKDYLIGIKKGVLPLDQAEWLANSVNKSIYEIAKLNQCDGHWIDKFAIKVLDDVKYGLLKQYFTEQLTQVEVADESDNA